MERSVRLPLDVRVNRTARRPAERVEIYRAPIAVEEERVKKRVEVNY
jgi:hypothetical protein